MHNHTDHDQKRQEMYENLWGPNAPEQTPRARYEFDLSFERTIDSDFIKAIHGDDPNGFENLLLRFPSYDINKDLKGYGTLLIQTVKSGNPDMLHTALRYGADINAVDSEGRNALMYAAVHDRPDMMAVLINQGADINAKIPVLGYTALHLASINSADQAVDFLLKSGAETNHLTFDGKKAKDLAGNAPTFDTINQHQQGIDHLRLFLTLHQQLDDVQTLMPSLNTQIADYRSRNGTPRLPDTGPRP